MRKKFLVAASIVEPVTHARLVGLFQSINHRDSFSDLARLAARLSEVVALLNGKNRVRDYAEPILAAAWHHPANEQVAFLFGRVVTETPRAIKLEAVTRLLYSGNHNEAMRQLNLDRVGRIAQARPDLAAEIARDIVTQFKLRGEPEQALLGLMIQRLPQSFTMREVNALLSDIGAPLRNNNLGRQRRLLHAVKDIAQAHPAVARQAATSLVGIVNDLRERLSHQSLPLVLKDRRDHRPDAAGVAELLPIVEEAHAAVRLVAQQYAGQAKMKKRPVASAGRAAGRRSGRKADQYTLTL